MIALKNVDQMTVCAIHILKGGEYFRTLPDPYSESRADAFKGNFDRLNQGTEWACVVERTLAHFSRDLTSQV